MIDMKALAMLNPSLVKQAKERIEKGWAPDITMARGLVGHIEALEDKIKVFKENEHKTAIVIREIRNEIEKIKGLING